MIEFSHPGAFFLLPVWAAAVWLLPQARLWRPLRVMVFLLFLIAWLDPTVNRKSRGLDVWVLNDRSLSARETVEPRLREVEDLLRESKGPHDRLHMIDFADEAVLRDELSAAILTGRRDATAIGNALREALSHMEDSRHHRILLLTDGFPTDAIDLAGERLVRQNVPLDLRLFGTPDAEDVRVEALNVPLQTRPGEPFLVEAVIEGPTGREVTVELLRNGDVLGQTTEILHRGRGRVAWTGRMDRPGAARYAVRVSADVDAFRGNNMQSQWVEARGGRRILLITAYADDPIAPILGATGMPVEVVTDPSSLTAGDLSGVAAVMIHNVFAGDVPREFLEAVPFYVKEQGGGFLMVGGKASFGSGGYFESPVDELLPVSMELKEEDRTLSIALGIVMDRSGSMSASVGGMTKMDMANSGAARAIELLGASDAVTVFAVDTEPHEIVPLSQVGTSRNRLLGIVRRIESMGGGIYVFNGLDAAWKQLQNSPQEQRHIILFSDAADSEQPEGVGRLLKEMTANNTTVSVIALGTEKDSDAPFLEQIAEDGQGRIFFNTDPSTLPEVFAQETVTVSRSAFLTEPVGVEPLPGWREIAAAPLDWPASVDGYNLSYLREEASESLRTTDRYAAPLLAHWQRGAGRAAAVSFPLGGEHSATVRAWPQVGDFIRTLSRWLVRKELPPGLALRTRRMGETVRLSLYANETWRDRLARNAPRLVLQSTERDEPFSLAWRRVKPGLMETDLQLVSGERVEGALRIGDDVLPFGPISGISGAEWTFDATGPLALRELAGLSGGSERVDLASIWNSPRRDVRAGTWPWWLMACALTFLFEALWSRLGGQRLEIDIRSSARLRAPKRPRSGTKSKKSGGKEKAEPSQPPAAEPERRSAFRNARHRGKL